jgi:hypothetical protein
VFRYGTNLAREFVSPPSHGLLGSFASHHRLASASSGHQVAMSAIKRAYIGLSTQ